VHGDVGPYFGDFLFPGGQFVGRFVVIRAWCLAVSVFGVSGYQRDINKVDAMIVMPDGMGGETP
jgi:hypothetical protein